MNARKIYIYPGNIAWDTQNTFTNADFLDPALSNHILAVSEHTINISRLITAKDFGQIKNRLSHNIVTNTLGVASYGCNRL